MRFFRKNAKIFGGEPLNFQQECQDVFGNMRFSSKNAKMRRETLARSCGRRGRWFYMLWTEPQSHRDTEDAPRWRARTVDLIDYGSGG